MAYKPNKMSLSSTRQVYCSMPKHMSLHLWPCHKSTARTMQSCDHGNQWASIICNPSARRRQKKMALISHKCIHNTCAKSHNQWHTQTMPKLYASSRPNTLPPESKPLPKYAQSTSNQLPTTMCGIATHSNKIRQHNDSKMASRPKNHSLKQC